MEYIENDGKARRVTYVRKLDRLCALSERKLRELEPVAAEFAFRSNDYYNSLIDWSDPADPLRTLIVPNSNELADWGELDACAENQYQPVQGVEHKYADTALLLCNDTCAAYCRFCFRKRLFQDGNEEVVKDVSPGLQYIRANPQINNVLLTGGDPLILSTLRLGRILDQLADIAHVRVVRIGTKVPAFNPFRILDDPLLICALEACSLRKQMYMMVHFNHVREMTKEALEAVRRVMRAGVTVLNQTPIIKGVNDSAELLADLFAKLTFGGIQPYYVFGCRPTRGNLTFVVPVEAAFRLFEQARARNSGLAKTARFVLSHKIGKIEVLHASDTRVLMRYHNAVDASLNGTCIAFRSNPKALWLDDYLGLECRGE